MWHYEIGSLPNGVRTDDPAWVAKFVEWAKSYIEFCCGPTLLGYCVGGIAGEDDIEDDTSLTGKTPHMLAVFYEDGEEEDASGYFEKCLVAYDRFTDAVVWERLQPSRFDTALRALGYPERIEFGEEFPASSPTMISNAEDLDAIEDAKTDACDLELVRLPPALQDLDLTEWHHWLTNWIADYVRFICGSPPHGTFVKLIWIQSPRWRRIRTGKPAKVVSGWGLCWEKDKTPNTVQFAEKFRFSYYYFLSNVNWKEIDGEKIQKHFEKNGYNDYLKKYYDE